MNKRALVKPILYLAAYMLLCACLIVIGCGFLPEHRFRASLLIVLAGIVTILGCYGFLKLRDKEKIVWKFRMELSKEEFLDHLDSPYGDDTGLDEIAVLLKKNITKKYGQLLAKRDFEYSALQSQINPHFLYNTLDSIRSQALVDDFQELAEIVELLSKYCRYSISKKKNFVTLRQEIENVENYFKIQQFRFEDRFDLKLDVSEEELYDAEIPKMILQPLVENALFHGLERKVGKGTVLIKVLSDGVDLFAFVSDDGVGMPFSQVSKLNYQMSKGEISEDKNRKTTGIALTNVNARIKLHYGKRYGLLLYSTEDMGTDVEISLPLIFNDDTNAMQDARAR